MMDAVREIYPTLELDERGLPVSNKEEYFRELVQGFCELIAEGKFLRGQKRALGVLKFLDLGVKAVLRDMFGRAFGDARHVIRHGPLLLLLSDTKPLSRRKGSPRRCANHS